jgi:hypothetical protein
MRDIKFRAWHRAAKEYCTGSTSDMFGWIDDGQPIELLQYIGLNYHHCGAAMCEGDIIKDHVGIGVINYWQRNCAFKVSYIAENAGQGKWFCDYILKGELESIELIGNIHENPELTATHSHTAKR